MLCTLLLSFGVPMLLGVDELGRTQGGNNNAYCQDNEISWVDWSRWTPGCSISSGAWWRCARRTRCSAAPVPHRRGGGRARLVHPGRDADERGRWNDPEALALGVYLDGSDAPDTGPDGQPLLDDDFLVLVNGWWEALEFTIPDCRPGLTWRAIIDTFDPAAAAAARPVRRAGDGSRLDPVRSGCCAARGMRACQNHLRIGAV